MLCVCLLGFFFERGQLNWPNHASCGLVRLRGCLASPESVNQVLNANDPLATQQFFHHDVVRNRHSSLCRLAFFLFLEEASFSNNVVEDHFSRLAVCDVVPDQQQFVECSAVSPDESDVVDFLEAEFFQDLLCLRRGVPRLLHSQHHQQGVHRNSLALRESNFLLVSDLGSNLSG